MDISRLRAMLLVAERGSISAASKELFITPVSLFQQMNHLESELGFKVFIRSNRGVKLTKPGEIFCQNTRKLLNSMDASLATCRKMDRESQKTINVSVYDSHDLNAYFSAYSEQHDEVRFHFKTISYLSSIAEQMTNYSVDIVQFPYNPDHITDDFEFLPILADRFYCLCSPQHDLASRQTISLDEIAPYDVQIYADSSVHYQDMEQKICKAGGSLRIQTFSGLESAQISLEIMLACSNESLFILDGTTMKLVPHLKAIPIVPEQPYVHGLIYRKDAPRSVLDFIHFVRKQIGEEKIAEMEEKLKIL